MHAYGGHRLQSQEDDEIQINKPMTNRMQLTPKVNDFFTSLQFSFNLLSNPKNQQGSEVSDSFVTIAQDIVSINRVMHINPM